MNPRALAAKAVANVVYQKQSLPVALAAIADHHGETHSNLIQELCYGTIRYFFRLEYLAQQLLKKPLRQKDNDIHVLLLIGFYQQLFMRIPDHAAISETVSATNDLGKSWAKGFLNATLRNLQRSKIELLNSCEKNLVAQYAHPQWLIEKVRSIYPQQWQDILIANNQQAPLSLRVNQQKISRDDYLQQLNVANITAKSHPYCAQAIVLDKACDVVKLPGFAQGLVSVQDIAAQLAAQLLNLQPNLRVLDACAAPGGKTAHLLESEPTLHMLALDKEAYRLINLQENLQRLQLQAHVVCADASQPETWWDKQKFARILLDAPCSATGVIRRHPDIKLLRTHKDIEKLAELQLILLSALWPLLEENGLLLYATCSILPEENQQIIKKFLQKNLDAKELPIDANWGELCEVGRQILPGETNIDGFYYARLKKIKGKD